MTWTQIIQEMKRIMSDQSCRFGGTVFTEETDNSTYATLSSSRPNQFLLRFGRNMKLEFVVAADIVRTTLIIDGRFYTSGYPVSSILEAAQDGTRTRGFVLNSSQEKVEIWLVSKEVMGPKKQMEISDAIMDMQNILIKMASSFGI